MRALVADDDPEMLDLVASTLRGEGLLVAEAVNGADLIRLATDGPPADLVVTDVNMPEVGGLEVLSHMQKHHPGVPVILMTSFATRGLCAEAAHKGPAAAILSKPFRLDALREAVAQHRPDTEAKRPDAPA
jgi:DNA-binding NtrC family response regulator